MNRAQLSIGLGVMVLATLFLALGNRTVTTVRADPSTMSWDLYMDDPSYAPTCASDGDHKIDQNECPDMASNLWLQPAGGTSAEAFFNLSNTTWSVTASSPTVVSKGIQSYAPAQLGAKLGQIDFTVTSNLHLDTVGFGGGIDDVVSNNDATVNGQRPSINSGGPIPVTSFQLWNATPSEAVTVPVNDANLNGVNDSQEPDATYPSGCVATNPPAGKSCVPKGVTMMPDPLPGIRVAMGLPAPQSRAFGLATVSLGSGFAEVVDVNFVVFQMLKDAPVNGYLQLTLVQYVGAQTNAPVNGVQQLGQMVATGPPYYSAPVKIYGITKSADFNGDTIDDLTVTAPEIHRQVKGTSGTFDYTIYKAAEPDYDGDTIPDGNFDRCRKDPATGAAAGDTDGDWLTGTCESTGAGNGEGTNPLPGGANITPPWDSGQDVDGDTFINSSDNCATVANGSGADVQKDTDRDGVGDACDPAINIPGDGNGWPVPAPGTFIRKSNICVDQFTIGQAEPQGEAGNASSKYCLAPESVATTAPYVNPVLASKLTYNYRDADNDGQPDWIGTLKMYDFSDTDGDTNTDACETRGMTATVAAASDSLDASSVPGTIPGQLAPLPLDCDGDTISDSVEQGPTRKTDFTKVDTDGDGLPDGVECPTSGTCVTNPLVKDTDNDGLTDGGNTATTLGERATNDPTYPGSCTANVTYPNGCNPNNKDTDGDGFMDGFDLYLAGGFSSGLACGLGPTTADLADGDGDGLKPAYECYVWGNEAGGNNSADVDKDGCFPSEEQTLNYKEGNPAIPQSVIAIYDPASVTDEEVGDAASHTARAQGFKLAVNAPVPVVTLWIKKAGTPGTPTDNLTVEIQTDDGGSPGKPTGTVVANGTSSAVAGSSVGTAYSWVSFTFPVSPSLTGGTKYHVVLKRSLGPDANNYYVWGGDTSGSYLDGNASLYDGSTWAGIAADDKKFFVEGLPGWTDDYMDVFTKINADQTANANAPDQAMSLLDVLAILKYVPSPPPGGGLNTANVNGVAYNSLKQGVDTNHDGVVDGGDVTGLIYDGRASAAPNAPWDTGAPDSAISLAGDVLPALAEVQPTNCAGAPN